MAAVPITIIGTITGMGGQVDNVTLIGMASITGLTVGGGPIMPPDQPPGSGPPGQPIHPIWGPPGFNPPGPGMPPGIWGDPIMPPPQLPPGATPPQPGDPTKTVPGNWPVQPVVPPPYIVVNYPGIGPVVVAPPVPASAPSPA